MLLLALMLIQQPAPGSILVATERSRDPDLAKSVVLIFQSSGDGVMGLIVNRPREKSPFFGGPIPIGVRTLSRSSSRDAQQILSGVFLGKSSAASARVYDGYAGWSPQQLIDEISRKLWKLRPGSAAIVFDPHPETLWQRLASSAP